MIFKLNVSVPDTTIARKFYSKYMKGTVIKETEDGSLHQYVKIFGQVSLHMHMKGTGEKQLGVHVVRFSAEEADLYNEAVALIKSAEGVVIDRDQFDATWGTTLIKFWDPFGYFWAYEIETKDLK